MTYFWLYLLSGFVFWILVVSELGWKRTHGWAGYGFNDEYSWRYRICIALTISLVLGPIMWIFLIAEWTRIGFRKLKNG